MATCPGPCLPGALADAVCQLMPPVSYTGVSNDFLVNTRNETALLYNDISVNENMHVATAFKIMRRPGNDLLEHLPADQYRYFRRTVIQIVLATDMAGHSELLQVCYSIATPQMWVKAASPQALMAMLGK